MIDTIKYHLFTAAAATALAFTLAYTANSVIKNTVLKEPYSTGTSGVNLVKDRSRDSLAKASAILARDFFEIGEIIESEVEEEDAPSQASDLILLGTISGPREIARAMIQNKSSKESDVFRIGQNAFGYTITGVTETKVYLVSGGNKTVLELYPPDSRKSGSSSKSNTSSSSLAKVTQNLSRSEINQILQGNTDNLIKGLRVGPYRENGEITGYTLKRVSSGNMLYKFGMRSGDIIKRINGHPINSSKKLMELTDTLLKEPRIIIDVIRKNEPKTFDFTISD